MPLWAQVWTARALVIVGIAYLCSLADSGSPAAAFALAWAPNGVFLAFFTSGALRLPSRLEPVHPIEPVLYRWTGVGLVKWLVTTRLWHLVVGLEPPPVPAKRREFLDRIEIVTKGAEICHGATLVLTLIVAVVCLAVGWTSAAGWILVFSMPLNGDPVMLQRSNRARIHRVRANHV